MLSPSTSSTPTSSRAMTRIAASATRASGASTAGPRMHCAMHGHAAAGGQQDVYAFEGLCAVHVFMTIASTT